MKNEAIYIAYYRVSTASQGASHLGLDAQRTSVEDYVNKNGGEIIECVTEIETAGSKDKISIGQNLSIASLLRKRPKLLQAIKLAEATGAKIIVKELSRLTRYSLLMEFLLNSKIQFVFADSPNDTPFINKLKVSLAEEEILRISERTRSALQERYKRKKRKPPARISLTPEVIKMGIAKRKELAFLNENNQKATGYILLLRKSGCTLSEIAKTLNKEGFLTSTGKCFWPSTVKMLLNRININQNGK